MEIPGARVVPEPVPCFPHRLRPGAGECLEIRKPLEKPRIVLGHAGYLRLLQHHFRDEHLVRIARLAPGEIARGAGVPGEELLGKCLGALRFSAAGGGRTGHAYTRYSHMARGAEITLDLRRLVGRWSLRAAGHAGRFTYLVLDMCRGLTEWRIYLPRAFRQAMTVGYGSLFIVLLVAGFTGAVTSLQAGYQFTGTVPLYVYGAVIAESIILELGPVLTGLILAGRIGARYAAELGTMRVTEQIDALESLGRSPVSHLIIPRVLAGMLVIPALVMFANVVGFAAGWIAAKSSIGITNADFIYGARYYFRPFDLWYSMIKAFFFAAAVTLIPCYIGYHTQQGAEGVGRSTTVAVVASSVTILFLDTLLAKVLLSRG